MKLSEMAVAIQDHIDAELQKILDLDDQGRFTRRGNILLYRDYYEISVDQKWDGYWVSAGIIPFQYCLSAETTLRWLLSRELTQLGASATDDQSRSQQTDRSRDASATEAEEGTSQSTDVG